VIVLKALSITEYPLVSLTLLQANVEVDKTTCSPDMRTYACSISLIDFPSVSSVTLIEDIVPSNSPSILMFNDKSKPLGKCPRLKVLKGRFGIGNNTMVSRLYAKVFRNTLSRAGDLDSKAVVDGSHSGG
jgi:hypothetical protein